MPPVDPTQHRAFAVRVVETLRERGFETYWAGGCVRDQLLGFQPKDYDVATAAHPSQVREVFGTRRTIAVGAAFGVIEVLGNKGEGQIEVATFRRDSGYSDGRHPDAVHFSTPEADAARRDFTINGLFYDPIDDRVIDFVGGRDDIVGKTVRAIGDAHARFTEDKLRLLRGVRFATTYGFALEDQTRRAIDAMAGEITVVSVERIAVELERMLVHRHRVNAVQLLRDTGLLAKILPEVTEVANNDSLALTLASLEELAEPSFALVLATLLQAFVDAAAAGVICRRFKLSNDIRQRVQWLLAHKHALDGARSQPWPQLQRLLIAPGIEDLMALEAALASASGRDLADLEYCRDRLSLPPEQLNPAPLITGDDLIRHRIPPGHEFQKLLDAARDAQLEGRICDAAAALRLIDQLRAG